MRSSDASKLLWLPCNAGMHQEFGTTAAPLGTIYSCTNSRLDTDGVLIKRPGHAGVAATVLANNPQISADGSTYVIEKFTFLTSVGDTAAVGLTNGDVNTYDEVGAVFRMQGRHSTAQPIRKRMGLLFDDTSNTHSFTGKQPAIAVNSQGYIAFACVNASGKADVIIETPDGARSRIFPNLTTSKVQILAVGATFYLIFQVGTAVKAVTVSVSAVGVSATVATLNSSSDYWDSSAYDSSFWVLAAQTGTTTITVAKFSGTTSSASASITCSGSCPVSIWGDGANGRVWVGYYNDPAVTGAVRFQIFNGSIVQTQADKTIVTGTDIYGPPIFGQFYDIFAPASQHAFYVFRRSRTTGNKTKSMGVGVAYSDGTSPTTPAFTPGVLPISKPDAYNRVWVQLAPSELESLTSGQGRALLLRYVTFVDGADVNPVIDLAMPPGLWLTPTYGPEASADRFHAMARTTSRGYFAFPVALANPAGDLLIKTEVVEYAMSDQLPQFEAERTGQTTAIAGGPTECYGFYSGSFTQSGLFEIGWAQRPTIISATQNTGSGVAAGTYVYRAIYEATDQYGRRHRSAPSLPVSITVSTDDVVDLVVSNIGITQRAATHGLSNIRILFYRTESGGTTYFRVPGAKVPSAASDEAEAFTDDNPDSALDGNEILYTDGGVLDNTLAPSCRFFAKSEDRLWCGGLWDPRIIECSKVIVPDEQVAFTNDATHQVVLPGDCTGLAYMDGQQVAFTIDEILVFGGDGPNDQGIGEFSAPRKMAQGIGCVDHRSIVETNVGVMFQSRRGIEILPRGFGPVQYIGKAVRGVFQTDGLTEVIAASVRMGDKGQTARFLVKTTAGTSTTTVLVYDIERGEWFRDTLAQASANMGVWPDGFVFGAASTSSSLYPYPFLYEDGTQVGDGHANDYVPQVITFARAYPFGSPSGWGAVNKVQAAVEAVGATQNLAVSVQADDGTAQAPTAWTITNAAPVNYREVVVSSHRCSGVTVILSDAVSSGATAGFRFLGACLELDPDGGIRPIAPSTERA